MIRGVGLAFVSSVLLAAGASASAFIPYVGTLKALDPSTRTLTIVGPDEKAFEVTLTGMLLEEGKGPFLEDSFEKALKYVGRRIGVRLLDAKTAHLACVMPEGELPVVKGKIFQVDTEAQRIYINSDGYNTFYRPAVNMSARSAKDGPLEDASWEWFEARIDKPYKAKIGKFAGLDVIWSIEPWDPKEDEAEAVPDPAAPATPEKSAAPPTP